MDWLSGLDQWIGSAVIATVITAALSFLRDIRAERRADHAQALETRKRVQLRQDMARALCAEIRSFQAHMTPDTVAPSLNKIRDGIEADPSFAPFFAKQRFDLVFRSYIHDLGAIPAETLTPVVAFYSQLDRTNALVDEMGEDRFLRLPSDRRLAIYEDYAAMMLATCDEAQVAVNALEQS